MSVTIKAYYNRMAKRVEIILAKMKKLRIKQLMQIINNYYNKIIGNFHYYPL